MMNLYERLIVHKKSAVMSLVSVADFFVINHY